MSLATHRRATRAESPLGSGLGGACVAAALVWAALAAPNSARAECGGGIPQPGNLNLCKVLVEDIFIDPQLPEPECIKPSVGKCAVSFFLSPALAQCCIPYACSVNPACLVVDVADTIAGYWAYAGDIYCDFEEIDPLPLIDRFVTGGIINASSQVIDAVTDVAHAHIEMLKCDVAKPLPSSLKTLVRQLVAYQSPRPFTNADIDAVQLVPGDDPTASVYLPSERRAITLEDVVIMRRDNYDLLMNTRPTIKNLIDGPISQEYVKAINLLIHELVHVRQYRESGDGEFLRNYLVEAAFDDYEELESEVEAYTLGSKNAAAVGGFYCWELRDYYEEKAMDMGIPSLALTCPWPLLDETLLAIVEQVRAERRRKNLLAAQLMIQSHP